MSQLLITALLLLFVSSVSGQNLLPNFNAYYNLNKGIIHFGNTRRSLTTDENGKIVFESETTAANVFSLFLKGHVLERSIAVYEDGIFKPTEYLYERTGKKQRLVKLVFNWDKLTVVNSINSKPWEMSLVPGTLDKLIYQLTLMQDLTSGKKEYRYDIADGGKLKTYNIVVLGEEEIETKLGKMKTIKITRKGDKRKTTLWCAPLLHNLPVKIQQTEKDGGQIVAKITKLEGIKLTDRDTSLKKIKAATENE